MTFSNRTAWLLVALALSLLVALSGCSSLERLDSMKQCQADRWRGWTAQEYCARKARELGLGPRGPVMPAPGPAASSASRELWRNVPGATVAVPASKPATRDQWWPATVQPL